MAIEQGNTVASLVRTRFGYIVEDARKSRKMLLLSPLRIAWLAACVVSPRRANRMREAVRAVRLRVRRSRRQQRLMNPPWPADAPLVSVVIPCHNYGEFVEAAVDSVVAQTLQNHEIIVVDGGSTHRATLERLRSVNKPKTKVYFREGQHLVGDNRNFGIERARGKYICCLDADDLLLPTYLEKALFVAETYEYDIVYPSVQCFGESDLLWRVHDVDFRECALRNGIPTVAVFRRAAWRRVGGYHDWGVGARHVAEDWDFWVRLLGSGCRAKSIAEPLMRYRIHRKGLSSGALMPLEHQGEIIRKANAPLFASRNLKRLRRIARTEYGVVAPYRNLVRPRDSLRKRVIFALPYMVIGGADTILLDVARCLCQNGFGLTIITTLTPDPSMGDNADSFRAITPDVYRLPEFLASRDEWRDFILFLIEAHRADALFIVGSEFVYSLLPKIKHDYPGVRVIDQLFNEFGHIENNRRYAACIDRIVVANDAIARVLIERHAERPERITTIIHGVDTRSRFDPSRIPPLAAPPGAPSLEGGFVISFVGRFSPEKCPEQLVRIAQLLQPRLESAMYMLIGNGPTYPQVRRKIDAAGLGHRFWAPGFVEDVRPYLRATSVLVIPSRIEGIPIVLMEALSLGVPVVASSVGGIPSMIRNGFNGYVCRTDDIADFADKIALLHADPALRRTLAENARAFALANLDLESMRRRYHELFVTELKGL